MAIYDIDLTTTPIDLSAMLGVIDGTAIVVVAQNVGQQSAYRMVATTLPTALTNAAFRYQPGESVRFAVHAGARSGNTYLAAGNGTTRFIVDDRPGD